MGGSRVAVCVLLVCCVLGQTLALDAEAQCSDAVAKTVIKALGGRTRIVTFMLNFIKCLQRSSNEIYKLINDLLIELTNCLGKADMVDAVKCMVSDSGMKRMSALVLKFMDVVKCGLD